MEDRLDAAMAVNPFLATGHCPCGRMDKPIGLWLCRCCYLEKEIHYAITELERDGDWPAAGLKRLQKLEDSRGTGGPPQP